MFIPNGRHGPDLYKEQMGFCKPIKNQGAIAVGSKRSRGESWEAKDHRIFK
jgi:hypothetical protein